MPVSPPPAILALDIATRFGWAFAEPQAVAAWPIGLLAARGPIEGVSYGSETCGETGGPRGPKFLKFARWLDLVVTSLRPGVVAVEGAIHHRTIEGMLLLGGLIGQVEMICYAREVALLPPASPATVKKHFAGSGSAQKPQIMAACDRRGWAPQDADAADALAVLDWGVHRWHARKG